MNELSNVGNSITSLKQNDILNVILYGDKNFDSNNNQSMMGTKTFVAIAMKVYSPQPPNLSDTTFMSNCINILDNPVYQILFKKALLIFYYFIIYYFCL